VKSFFKKVWGFVAQDAAFVAVHLILLFSIILYLTTLFWILPSEGNDIFYEVYDSMTPLYHGTFKLFSMFSDSSLAIVFAAYIIFLTFYRPKNAGSNEE